MTIITTIISGIPTHNNVKNNVKLTSRLLCFNVWVHKGKAVINIKLLDSNEKFYLFFHV